MNTEIPSIKGAFARIVRRFLDRIPEGNYPDTLYYPEPDRRAKDFEGREIAPPEQKNISRRE